MLGLLGTITGMIRAFHLFGAEGLVDPRGVTGGVAEALVATAVGSLEARFDVINVLGQNYVLRDGTGVGIFAKQFGPPRGFFGGVKKEF